MEWLPLSWLMEIIMKVWWKMDYFRERENIHGKMDLCMKDNLSSIKLWGMDILYGLMVVNMKVKFIKDIGMELEIFTVHRMDANMMDNG